MTVHTRATIEYPGDATHIVYLRRGMKVGSVRVQKYSEDTYRVGAFVPGCWACIVGDTPKFEPEHSEWVASAKQAEHEFNYCIARCKSEGWIEVDGIVGEAERNVTIPAILEEAERTTRPAPPYPGDHIKMAHDRETRRIADTAFDKLSTEDRIAKIEHHLAHPQGYPVPAPWVRWLLDTVEWRS